jgi:hypothetical protein
MEETYLKVLQNQQIKVHLQMTKILEKIIKVKARIMEINPQVKNLKLVMDHKIKV